MSIPIHIDALRIGMFVHLNIGWMSHPFPLSSFKVTTQAQLDKIRALGLWELRWSPERSDVVLDSVLEDDVVDRAEAAPPPAPRSLSAAAVALATQREAVQRCESQFSEACGDLRSTFDRVMGDPLGAAGQADQLARALLDKMLVDDDTRFRVLGDGGIEPEAAHTMNVTVISLMLGRHIGLGGETLQALGVGALLHDVGKLALPSRVRSAREDFTPRETASYRDHVALGESLARRMALPREAVEIIVRHHEWADGSGFPRGAGYDGVSTAARIVAMVDGYDELCNRPVPEQSLTPHEALSRMFSQGRSKFDAMLLGTFIKMMGIYPPGSAVQLGDERYALVTTVNPAHPLKPRVLVFDPDVAAGEALHLDLENCPGLGIRRSLRPAQLPLPAARYLQPRRRINYFFDAETPAVRAGDHALSGEFS